MRAQSSVYRHVISDVMDKIQTDFLNSGIDESVLGDLRTVRPAMMVAPHAMDA
jgi:hypothetical protein